MNSASVKEERSIRSQVKWVKAIICLGSIFADGISFHELPHSNCAGHSQIILCNCSKVIQAREKNMATIQIAISYADGDSRRIVSKQETNHIKSQALFERGTFVTDNTSRCIYGLFTL